MANRWSFIVVWWLGLWGLVLVWLSAHAALPVELNFASQLETLSGPGWQAEAVVFRTTRKSGQPGTLTLSARRLTLSALPSPLENVNLRCSSLIVSSEEINCPQATLRIARLQGNSLEGRLGFTHRPKDGKTELMVSDLSLAGGLVDLTAQLDQETWQAQLKATRLTMTLLESWLSPVPGLALAEGQNHGLVNVTGGVSGSGENLEKGKLQIQSTKLSGATASGHYATADVAFRFTGQWQASGRFSSELRIFQGQIYSEPVFLQVQPAQAPLVLRIAGRYKDPVLILDNVSFSHPGIVQAQAKGQFDLGEENPLQQAHLTINEAVFPDVYTTYLQPFSADGALGQLQTQGRLQGHVAVADDGLQALRLQATEVYLKDALNRFGLKGLNGDLVWSPDSKPQDSQLGWDEGNVYELTLGAGELSFESKQGVLRLRKESRIPVLDGALSIAQMEAKGLGEPIQWRFDGLLTPLSMATLSQALGWPPLAGKLSGMMPDVHYDNDRLKVGGSLLVRMFEGDITITDLRIEELFGTMPKAFANIDLRNLNLETLTRAFDFGRIEGKLSGQIKDLQLVNWQPVHFDAILATPKDDKSRRRISQQAVQNLSALSGGDPTAVLSRGILRLFKTFRYKRLGLQCRLRNGICEMSGVGPAGAGYYLVQGEGLPRIDVIGYNPQVDWDELVTRLQAAMQSGRPIVE